MVMDLESLKFRCCFCDKGIKETKVDPLDISLMGLKKLRTENRSSVDFYCHFACAQEKLHPYFQGYMIEGIFAVDEDESL